MSKSEANKKMKVSNPLRALVHKGVDDIFKMAEMRSLLVERLLKDYALETVHKEDADTATQQFDLWRSQRELLKPLSLEGQRVLFVLRSKYKVDAIISKFHKCKEVLVALIHHIIDKFYDDFQRVQNSAPKGARMKSTRLQKQQTTEKGNLLRNISLN